MTPMTKSIMETPHGTKSVEIMCADIKDLDEPLDVMTISAFLRDYSPVPGTVIGALRDREINVEALAERPLLDLRKTNNVWLSDQIRGGGLPIRRIGCAELTAHLPDSGWDDQKDSIFDTIQAYFRMLELAGLAGIPVETVGIPILGAGNQNLPVDLVLIPLLNECLRLLRQCRHVRRILIFSRSPARAYQAAKAVDTSYTLNRPERQAPRQDRTRQATAFISYAGEDKNIADNLCAKLEARGIRVWYAPRNATGAYAADISNAITSCTHFICILSQNSLRSQHVLSEVDLAFNELNRSILFRLLKIDEEALGPAFRYYLSRQHWMDAQCPPLEKRLEEFADRVAAEWSAV